MNSCFLFGHRDAEKELLDSLMEKIDLHITNLNVREFIVGQHGNFDRMAAHAVRKAQERYPEIQLTLLLSAYPADKGEAIPSGFDASFYPPGMEEVPKRMSIVRANRYMIDHSNFVIAYAHYLASNSFKLLEYARRREKRGQLQISLLDRPNRAL